MVASYEMYQEQILDHYKRPRNKGVLDAPTHEARASNPLCGDEIALYLRVDSSNRIADIRFQGQGCAISQASASMLTEGVRGRTLDEARTLSRDEVLRRLGIPLSAVRMKCALLSLHVLQAAVGAPTKGT